jgi:hypothetical protein
MIAPQSQSIDFEMRVVLEKDGSLTSPFTIHVLMMAPPFSSLITYRVPLLPPRYGTIRQNSMRTHNLREKKISKRRNLKEQKGHIIVIHFFTI